MMAYGRDASAWNHTSHLLAALLNSNPFREGEPFTARQLNPYAEDEPEDEGPEMSAMDFALLLCGPKAAKMFAEADKRQTK